jgi:hypothetical protein
MHFTHVDSWQAFYYTWYGSQPVNGQWRHWGIDTRPEGGVYDPTHGDLPTDFYPDLGPYSSTSTDTLTKHMSWLTEAGIGTIIVSWWGKGSYEDKNIWNILNAADDWGLKVGFNIEPYGGGYIQDIYSNVTVGSRTPQTAKDDVKYIVDTYGCHRAMYRRKGRPVFMFFASRSYNHGNQTEWKQAWDELHADPIYNPVVIGHDVNLGVRIIPGGWDGGHEYGTQSAFQTSAAWEILGASYALANKILYFTVSPGYDKSRKRGCTDPIISRQDGLLYQYLWLRAIGAKVNLTKTTALNVPQNPVIITSFNEVRQRRILLTRHSHMLFSPFFIFLYSFMKERKSSRWLLPLFFLTCITVRIEVGSRIRITSEHLV